MPHPRGGYRDADGKRIPGVTTIIGRFKESGGLIRWAYGRGRDGEELYESRDKAAEAGTAAHEMCERHIKGDILIEGGEPTAKAREVANVPDEMFSLVWSSFQAYLAWERQTQLKIVETEQSYISAKGFGGTYDAIGEIDGKLCLLDWKTSNAVYGDHIYQLGAYKALFEENNPEKKLDGGYHLLRFAKTHGDFTHHFWPNLDEAIEGFMLMLRLYQIDKGVKKRV